MKVFLDFYTFRILLFCTTFWLLLTSIFGFSHFEVFEYFSLSSRALVKQYFLNVLQHCTQISFQNNIHPVGTVADAFLIFSGSVSVGNFFKGHCSYSFLVDSSMDCWLKNWKTTFVCSHTKNNKQVFTCADNDNLVFYLTVDDYILSIINWILISELAT